MFYLCFDNDSSLYSLCHITTEILWIALWLIYTLTFQAWCDVGRASSWFCATGGFLLLFCFGFVTIMMVSEGLLRAKFSNWHQSAFYIVSLFAYLYVVAEDKCGICFFFTDVNAESCRP